MTSAPEAPLRFPAWTTATETNLRSGRDESAASASGISGIALVACRNTSSADRIQLTSSSISSAWSPCAKNQSRRHRKLTPESRAAFISPAILNAREKALPLFHPRTRQERSPNRGLGDAFCFMSRKTRPYFIAVLDCLDAAVIARRMLGA